MLYLKNLPNWERVLRLIIASAGLLFVYLNWGSSMLGVIAGLSATMLALTAVFGFCPMCALFGRRLDKKQ